MLANIESAQRQNRLYDALKQGNTALAALQQVSSLRGLPPIFMNPSPSIAPSTLQHLAEYIAVGFLEIDLFCGRHIPFYMQSTA